MSRSVSPWPLISRVIASWPSQTSLPSSLASRSSVRPPLSVTGELPSLIAPSTKACPNCCFVVAKLPVEGDLPLQQRAHGQVAGADAQEDVGRVHGDVDLLRLELAQERKRRRELQLREQV